MLHRLSLSTATLASLQALTSAEQLLSADAFPSLARSRPAASLRRRLSKAYSESLALGFGEADIQAGLTLLFSRFGDADESSLLDVLTLVAQQLPPRFAAVACDALAQGRVSLLTRADGELAERRQVETDAAWSGPALLPAPPPPEEDKADLRRWILSYAEEASSFDSGDDERYSEPNVVASSSRASLALEQRSTQDLAARWASLDDPLTARPELGASLREYREKAVKAKAAKDVDTQKSCGEAIRRLRDAMTRLGLSEEECLSHAPQKEPQQQPEGDSSAAVDEIEQPSIFDDTAPQWQPPKAPPARRAPPAPGAAGKGAKSRPPPPPVELRMPKALLQEQCAKRKWPPPRFEKCPTGERGTFCYAVQMEWLPPDAPTTVRGVPRLQGVSFSLPDDLAVRNTVEEAQNAAACLALVRIAAGGQHSPMPPVYESLCAALEELEAQRVRDDAAEARSKDFISSLLGSSPPPESIVESTASAAAAHGGHGGGRRRCRSRAADIAAALEACRREPAGPAIAAARASLPICAIRGELRDALKASDVVMVCGSTGCGKSTQARIILLLLLSFQSLHTSAILNRICHLTQHCSAPSSSWTTAPSPASTQTSSSRSPAAWRPSPSPSASLPSGWSRRPAPPAPAWATRFGWRLRNPTTPGCCSARWASCSDNWGLTPVSPPSPTWLSTRCMSARWTWICSWLC